jgi:hypothetical protein
MDTSDKAFSTLTLLRTATWLDNDKDILTTCKELVDYFSTIAGYEVQHETI